MKNSGANTFCQSSASSAGVGRSDAQRDIGISVDNALKGGEF
jgi:hypothetical protein